MWVIKAKGESYYVNHVECNIPWSTKETPENSHTKGSLKIKRCHLVIDDENTAHLNELTPEIEARLNKPEVIIRVITSFGAKLKEAVANVEHVGIKTAGGGCGTLWYITEFNSEEEFVMFKLSMDNNAAWRELKPNEEYYKLYEKYKSSKSDHIYEDEDDEDDEFYDEDDYLPEPKEESFDYSDLYTS
jgi:hypothetical protein